VSPTRQIPGSLYFVLARVGSCCSSASVLGFGMLGSGDATQPALAFDTVASFATSTRADHPVNPCLGT
jgi:hypothetical protein